MKISVTFILANAAAAFTGEAYRQYEYTNTSAIWGNDCIDTPSNPGYVELDLAPVRKTKGNWEHIALGKIMEYSTSSEKVPKGWIKRERAPQTQMMRLSIYMGQRGDDRLEDTLKLTRMPRHRMYGHKITESEKQGLLTPRGEAIVGLHRWLELNGVKLGDIHYSEENRTMYADMAIATAESMLHTQFHVFEVRPGGCRALRATWYKLPWFVWEKVGNYAVTPTDNFYDIEFTQESE